MMKKVGILCLIVLSVFVVSSYKCNEIKVTEHDGIYVVQVPHEKIKNITPYVSSTLMYNSDVYNETGAELVVNAGYFDPNNKKTTSYVVVNGEVVSDPTQNKSLMENGKLKDHMDQILDRTEFRVLDCKGTRIFDIQKHSAPPAFYKKNQCKIVHSIQGGPELYPELRLEDEYFVEWREGSVYRDAISALQRCPRTAIGVKDNDVFIIIATTYHRMTLPELAKFCKDLGLNKAMNFDGGGSSSLNFRGNSSTNNEPFEIISDKDKTARRLKSFWVIN